LLLDDLEEYTSSSERLRMRSATAESAERDIRPVLFWLNFWLNSFIFFVLFSSWREKEER